MMGEGQHNEMQPGSVRTYWGMHTFVEVRHRRRVAWEAGADDAWMKSVRRGRDEAHRCGWTRTGAWMQGHGGCRATWTRRAWTTVGMDRGDSEACGTGMKGMAMDVTGAKGVGMETTGGRAWAQTNGAQARM